jgi:hypothetical protein
MKLKSIMLAAGLLAVPAIALAQSAPSPNNQSGPGVSPSVQAPTDMGAGGASGNTKAVPARKGAKQSMKKGGKANAPTTGSSLRESKKRNASPASPAEGAEKVK